MNTVTVKTLTCFDGSGKVKKEQQQKGGRARGFVGSLAEHIQYSGRHRVMERKVASVEKEEYNDTRLTV